MTYKEQKEFETIEDDIAAVETRIEEIATGIKSIRAVILKKPKNLMRKNRIK